MLNDPVRLDLYRYSDWFLTTPLMLIAILGANGVSVTITLGILSADLLMIGAATPNESAKIAYFTIGCIALLPILYTLFIMKKARWAIFLTLVLWCLYPVLWYADEETMVSKSVAKVGLVNLLDI